MDLDFAFVPRTVSLNGIPREVVSALYCPGGDGLLHSHIVVYPNGREGLFNVHYYVYDDDAQTSSLHQGSYDLSYRAAMVEATRRYSINAGNQHVEIVQTHRWEHLDGEVCESKLIFPVDGMVDGSANTRFCGDHDRRVFWKEV